jgi:hypothetical protein
MFMHPTIAEHFAKDTQRERLDRAARARLAREARASQGPGTPSTRSMPSERVEGLRDPAADNAFG